MKKSPQRTAMLGLGSMGSRMAARIAQAGHELVVWNRSTPAVEQFLADHPTSRAATTPAEAVADADVAIAMLTDDDASRTVWLDSGALDALTADAVAVEASTVRPEWIRTLADEAARRAVSLIDAPVVGSRPQADAGALLSLVGGEATAVDRARDAIGTYSGAVRHVGGLGDGATLKLAVNSLFGIQVAAYAEIVGLLDRSTVDTADAIDVLAGLPITSPGLQRVLGLIAERSFAPNFPVSLVAKDFAYALESARSLDAAVPITGAAAEVFAAGAQNGQGDLDISGIAARYV